MKLDQLNEMKWTKRRFGQLGNVNQQQIDAHKDAGEKKHKWSFAGSHGTGKRNKNGHWEAIEEYHCLICGATKKKKAK